MGVTIRQKPKNSGVWWVFVNHNGARRSKRAGNKRTAKEMAQKIEAKLALGEFNINQERQFITFGEYAKTWIDVTVPATCKPSTETDYRCLLKKHIIPKFGKLKVNEINKLMVKEFLMSKTASGYAASTVTHIKNVISGVLNMAVDDEAITANPVHRLGRIMREKGLRLEIDPLNKDELQRLLNSFKEHFPRHYPLALTLARTGMRLGEAMALQWGDIDFHGRFIKVQRGFSRCRIETPKSGKSRRVDMSRQLTDELLKLNHHRKMETLRKGWKQVPDWIFLSEEGRTLDTYHWRKRVFNKALEKAKLRKIRIHDLRHSYASLLIQQGESLAYIRDQLGHHSIKVTVDIYGHLAPEGNKAAVDRLDDAPGRTLSAPRHEKSLTQNVKDSIISI